MSELRAWQREALERVDGVSDTYVIEACPGAGKTRFALEAARKLMENGLIEQVTWVVPSLHLVEQTSDAAVGFGMTFRSWDNGQIAPPADAVGRVVTYQSVASQPMLFARDLGSTLVILDEVHHVGAQRTWGTTIRDTFQKARFKLLMTGTPWREDGSEIPFVSYDDAGELEVTYSYSLKRAWGEKPSPIRSVGFPHVKATGKWIEKDGTYREVAGEEADNDEEGKAIASFHRPDCEWTQWAFNKAQECLARVKRRHYPDAQGLIIARDQWHADRYAEQCQALGMTCEVVHLEQRNPHQKLRQFQDSSTDWLIAVGMVSEGYDNPRLSVLVYASRDRTALSFHQAFGRVTRIREPSDTTRAQVIVPDTPTLAHLVVNIEESQRQALKREFEEIVGTGTLKNQDSIVDSTHILPATDAQDGRTVTKGQDPSELARVALLEDPERFREFYERHSDLIEDVIALEEVEEAPAVPAPMSEAERRRLFNQHNRMVNRLARNWDVDHKVLWNRLNTHYGQKSRRQRTDEELRDEGRLLTKWISGDIPAWA